MEWGMYGPSKSPTVQLVPVMSILLIIIDYGIHIFLFIDWLKVHHVIKNKFTILQK